MLSFCRFLRKNISKEGRAKRIFTGGLFPVTTLFREKGLPKSPQTFRKPKYKKSSSYIAVRAVRTRYSMACTGYCPAAVSPVSIRLDAPSSTAL